MQERIQSGAPDWLQSKKITNSNVFCNFLRKLQTLSSLLFMPACPLSQPLQSSQHTRILQRTLMSASNELLTWPLYKSQFSVLLPYSGDLSQIGSDVDPSSFYHLFVALFAILGALKAPLTAQWSHVGPWWPCLSAHRVPLAARLLSRHFSRRTRLGIWVSGHWW